MVGGVNFWIVLACSSKVGLEQKVVGVPRSVFCAVVLSCDSTARQRYSGARPIPALQRCASTYSATAVREHPTAPTALQRCASTHSATAVREHSQPVPLRKWAKLSTENTLRSSAHSATAVREHPQRYSGARAPTAPTARQHDSTTARQHRTLRTVHHTLLRESKYVAIRIHVL